MSEPLAMFYSEFVGQHDLCFDIGANVGDKAQVLSDLGARVVCVEPQSSCVVALRQRFERNPLVEVVHAAVGAEPGELTMKICRHAPTISTFSDKWTTGRFAGHSWDGSETVRVTTLDELVLTRGSPSYCKIDVEGYETAVMAGLSTSVGYLSFEFTEEFFDDALVCLERAQRIAMGEFNFTLGEAPRFVLPHWVDGDALADSVQREFGDLCWGDIYCRRQAGTPGDPA